MIRTFGAIGDIHAEDEFLAAALDHLRQQRVDAILAVGDLVDGRGDVPRCVELLRGAGVLAVRGNHERWFLDDRVRNLPRAHRRHDVERSAVEWIDALPVTRTLDTVAGRLLLCHGVGDDDMVRLLPEDPTPALAGNEPLQRVLASGAELMVCGHTHRPMVRTLFGLTVINAGTLYFADAPGFVHVDLGARVARFFSIDDDARVREAEQVRFGDDDVWGSGF